MAASLTALGGILGNKLVTDTSAGTTVQNHVLGAAGTIFWFVIFGWSGISATFCPVIILSLFWKRLTGKGAIAAMVTGGSAVITWWLAKRAGWTDLHEVYVGLVVSTVVYVVATLVGPTRNGSPPETTG